MIGAVLVELRAFEKREILLADHHVLGTIVGFQRNTRLVLPDVGFDGLGSYLAGDGDAVVAVEDKVDFAHLVNLDGGYATHGAELIHFLPGETFSS
ncbi:MAG: hypothetical protein V3S14_09815 [Anaerolineae bacterium]